MASWISRVRLEVSTTIGGSLALTVPISGIVIWKSDSTSKKIRLERLVGAVQFIDQQHGRRAFVAFERLHQRPLDEKRSEKMSLATASRDAPSVSAQPYLDHLARIVPLVYGGGDVETFVALEAHPECGRGPRRDLRDLGLADAGLTFEKQGPAHLEGEEPSSQGCALRHSRHVRAGEGVVDRLR